MHVCMHACMYVYDEKINVIENWLHPKYIFFHF